MIIRAGEHHPHGLASSPRHRSAVIASASTLGRALGTPRHPRPILCPCLPSGLHTYPFLHACVLTWASSWRCSTSRPYGTCLWRGPQSSDGLGWSRGGAYVMPRCIGIVACHPGAPTITPKAGPLPSIYKGNSPIKSENRDSAPPRPPRAETARPFSPPGALPPPPQPAGPPHTPASSFRVCRRRSILGQTSLYFVLKVHV